VTCPATTKRPSIARQLVTVVGIDGPVLGYGKGSAEDTTFLRRWGLKVVNCNPRRRACDKVKHKTVLVRNGDAADAVKLLAPRGLLCVVGKKLPRGLRPVPVSGDLKCGRRR
jgi:hypothetical protein